jgi:hypothetical protein
MRGLKTNFVSKKTRFKLRRHTNDACTETWHRDNEGEWHFPFHVRNSLQTLQYPSHQWKLRVTMLS